MINLQKALDALRDAEVEFVLIGEVAGVAHGSAQTTEALEICYQRSRETFVVCAFKGS